MNQKGGPLRSHSCSATYAPTKGPPGQTRQMRDSSAPQVYRRRCLVLAGLQVLMFVGTGTQGHQPAAEHMLHAPVNATIGLLVPISFRSFVPPSFLQTAIMALLAIHHVNTRDESVVGPDTVALLRQGFQVGTACIPNRVCRVCLSLPLPLPLSLSLSCACMHAGICTHT